MHLYCVQCELFYVKQEISPTSMHLYFVHCEILYVKQEISPTSMHLYFVHCEILYAKQWNITNQHAFVFCALRDSLYKAVDYH